MWQQDIKKSDWIKAAVTGIILGTVVTYLFYNSFISFILVPPFAYIYVRQWHKEKCKGIEKKFKKQFVVAITILTNLISVGYSVENAIKEVVRELEIMYGSDEICIKEFIRIQHLLQMNLPIEQAMSEMAVRVHKDDVQNFVTVFTSAKRAGGDTISIMNETVRQMSEGLETEEEIDTVISSGRLEFKIMCTVPFVILLYMRFAFPEFMTILYGNILGVSFMTICLAIYVCAYIIGRKIITIEV